MAHFLGQQNVEQNKLIYSSIHHKLPVNRELAYKVNSNISKVFEVIGTFFQREFEQCICTMYLSYSTIVLI